MGRRPREAPSAVIALVALALAGCAAERPLSHRRAAPNGEQQRAAEICCRQRPRCDLPPREFTTDACTLWPDGDWGACCVEHDIAYWCGGSADDRAAADDRFRACVEQRSDGWFSSVSYVGVRIGGVSWLPTPWRWGYGWDWLGEP